MNARNIGIIKNAIGWGILLTDLPKDCHFIVIALSKRAQVSLTRMGSTWWVENLAESYPKPLRSTEPLPDDPPF